MNPYDDNTNERAKDLALRFSIDYERNFPVGTIKDAINCGYYTQIAAAFSRAYMTTLLFEHTWRKCSKNYDVWTQFRQMHEYLSSQNFDDVAKLCINTKVQNQIQVDSESSGVMRSAISATSNKPSICNL